MQYCAILLAAHAGQFCSIHSFGTTQHSVMFFFLCPVCFLYLRILYMSYIMHKIVNCACHWTVPGINMVSMCFTSPPLSLLILLYSTKACHLLLNIPTGHWLVGHWLSSLRSSSDSPKTFVPVVTCELRLITPSTCSLHWLQCALFFNIVSSISVICWGVLFHALHENLMILRVDAAEEECSAALFTSWVERVGVAER